MKMQEVKFRDVDDFLEFLPGSEREMVDILREMIFDNVPGITEKLSYNVPFYKLKTTVCFIWPASVLWGKKKTYDGVRFGFAKGYLLTDEPGYLEKGERKQVYWKDFLKPADIDIPLLKSFLFEAVSLDGINKQTSNGIRRKTRRAHPRNHP